MTSKQKAAIKFNIKQKYLKGEITLDEFDSLVDQLQDLAKKGASLQEANAQLGMYKTGSAPKVKPVAQASKTAAGASMTEDEKKKLMHQVMTKHIDKKISKSDADKIMDMLQYLKDTGVSNTKAQAILNGTLNMMENAKLSVEEAMEYHAKYKHGMQPVTQTSKPAVKPGVITDADSLKMQNQLMDMVTAGKMTFDEFSKKQEIIIKMLGQGKQLTDVQTAVGLDPASLEKEKAIDDLEKELKGIYEEAAQEIKKQLWKIQPEESKKIAELQTKYNNGEITKEEFDKSVKKLVFTSNLLKQKIDQLTGVTLNANQKATAMINKEQLGVFAEGAAYQAYQISKNANLNLMFTIYDENTVEKLIKDKPELLPRKEVNGKKDKAWNKDKIANAMIQGILQGDSIPKLAKRVAAQTGETNMKAMIRYARTAMTAAQNSGRQEMLERAVGMGIKVKKVWMATIDSRTRDTHAALDGDKVDVDKKFSNGLMYPGDPNGAPAEVYNCRCTLVYDYEGFPHDPVADQRLMYDEWDETVTVTKKDKNGKEYEKEEVIHHRESRMIQNMPYKEWKAAKDGSVLNDLNMAKVHLAEAQKDVIKAKINESKVYKDLWKDPVTLADYEAKKAGIQAKKDYYAAEIQKYEDAQANGASWATDEKIKDLKKKQKLLEEFEKNGKLIQKRNEAVQAVQAIYNQVGFQQTAQAPAVAQTKAKKVAKKASAASGGANAGAGAPTQNTGPSGAEKTPFGPEAYSQERKDKALWSSDKRYVDSIMRPHTGEVWNKATAAEKEAIVEYTQSYHKFNEPLRGIEYGTSVYKGVGNTDLNAGHANNGRRMNAMTDLIDKCSYDHDMWLQRGCGYGGMDKFFQCSPDLLQNGTQDQLIQALLGTTPTEYAFGSMGSAKGKGFSTHPIIMNIYAPSGTKMMYVEPFSHYGGHMYNWDGKQGQSHFGDEFETLLQQGTQFRITKIERPRRGGTIYFDLEVINQDNQQRWKKK